MVNPLVLSAFTQFEFINVVPKYWNLPHFKELITLALQSIEKHEQTFSFLNI